MDPTTTCCPNMACPARDHTGQGHSGIDSRQDRRFLRDTRQSPTEQRSEIETNMQFFQKVLGQVVPIMAYPYGGLGTWGNETKRILKDLGLEGGFTMARRVVKPKDLNERWEIPRFDVRDIFSPQGELNYSVLDKIVVED